MPTPQLGDKDAVPKVTLAETPATANELLDAADKAKAEKDKNDEKVAAKVEKVAEDLRKSRFYERVVMPLAIAFLGTMQVIAIAYIGLLDRRGTRIEGKVDATHELVNSGSLVQLKQNASLSHWKADQTKVPADIRAAEEADKLVEEHIEKQKKSDATKVMLDMLRRTNLDDRTAGE